MVIKRLTRTRRSDCASVRALDTQLETPHRSSCRIHRKSTFRDRDGYRDVRRSWSCGTARGRGSLWLKDERRNLRRRWIQWIADYHKDWSCTRLSYRWEEPIATTTAAWQERGLELETPAPGLRTRGFKATKGTCWSKGSAGREDFKPCFGEV